MLSLNRTAVALVCLSIALAGCAGHAANPVTTVQAQDQQSDCTMIRAEIEANNITVRKLGGEQGVKVAQNVAAGVAGLFVWPLLFAMDWQGSAGKEVTALQARQQFLTVLATQRCTGPSVK